MSNKPSSVRKYPAKVLLFGEYTVLLGGSALAVPYPGYQLTWTQQETNALEELDWQSVLAYLKTNASSLVATEKLESDLNSGWTLTGEFPVGCGLGSSGAVVAAIADRYGLPKAFDLQQLEETKRSLALLENFFHGSSSGIDPLVSLANTPLETTNGATQPVTIPALRWGEFAILLIDTDLTRESKNLVPNFLKQVERSAAFRQAIDSTLLPMNQRAIKALKTNNKTLLWDAWKSISLFQHDRFKPMIPDNWQDWWMGAYQSELVIPKLCGAGGGGFLLGLTKDLGALQKEIPQLLIEVLE